MEPIYSLAEFSSSIYRWRQEGKILATIFSQTFPLGNASNSRLWKVTEEDEAYGNMDVDAKALRKLFKDETLFPVPVDVVYKTALSFEKVQKYIKNINEEAYDCFFFCFLTYTEPENSGTNFHDERLHFNDTTLEKGIVSFSKVLDEVKSNIITTGKPKVFLIQSDDVSFLVEKQYLKGPTFVPDVKKMKIPKDADRLIIKSTIPQRIASWDLKEKKYTKEKTPSFLVQAFVETVRENAARAKEETDLLTLTPYINAKVDSMIQASGHLRKKDMYVPLITSTFTKLLFLNN